MSSEQALVLIAWSRVWSPIIPEEQRVQAWQALDLPDNYETHKADYWTTFHVGDPQPMVPLILHASLRQEGSSVREDWLQVVNYLGLTWDASILPPDQLGAACEIFACAVDSEEPVIINELRNRYLLPWSEQAIHSLTQAQSPLAPLAEKFSNDIKAISVN